MRRRKARAVPRMLRTLLGLGLGLGLGLEEHEEEEGEGGAQDVAHLVLARDELVQARPAEGRAGGEEAARLLDEQLGACTRAQRRRRRVPARRLARGVRRHWR